MWFLFRRWVAGPRREQAIRHARKMNAKGIGTVINFLGEHYTKQSDVEKTVTEYEELIREIRESKIRSDVSIKLTQFGLGFSKEICTRWADRIVSLAERAGVFVWIDMESSEHTDDTIEIYKNLLKKHRNIGVTLQARLRRSGKDAENLAGATVRVVKGAYKEHSSVAYTGKDEIRKSYTDIIDVLLSGRSRVAAATHDTKMIRYALSKKSIEVQMLMGVKNRLKIKLAKRGRRVKEYVPYGEKWIPYVMRRMMERKRNIVYVLRSLLE